MVYITQVTKSEEKLKQTYVIETTWMSKVEQNNVVNRTTTETRVYRKQGVHNTTQKIGTKAETNLCNWNDMNVESWTK